MRSDPKTSARQLSFILWRINSLLEQVIRKLCNERSSEFKVIFFHTTALIVVHSSKFYIKERKGELMKLVYSIFDVLNCEFLRSLCGYNT